MAGTIRSLILISCAAGLLGACVKEGGSETAPADGATAAAQPAGKPARSVKLVDRDIEAPEIFQTTDTALWDGRPSLGGVWVASPDATDPERVILRNPANGKFVIGALFRRERENPGPKLQISSDAASALGLLAGQPGKINVTALRREEVPVQTDASKPLLDAAETLPGEGAAVTADTKTALAKPGAAKTAAPAGGAAAIPAGTIAGGPIAAQPVKPGAAAKGGSHTAQIGIFSVEANAKRAVDQLSKAGVSATLRKGQTQGKDHWSVTASGADRAALLAKVKSLGFTDAYIIR
ncbi:SPOR domain-containing protein [Gemmobacter serpentinus]|uniref:SPOR domain-containing protein n=1 Tax=Gemmobacter serpentinus TaxID=2652247 RepID=UPI00124E5EDE|nr:SPOR domain-containing protein [Gemmobacter serpentinus]